MGHELLQRPNLPEFRQLAVFGEETLDANGHVNHAHYFPMYEANRIAFIEACGLNLVGLKELDLNPFTTKFKGSFQHQVFAGEPVTVYTSAQVEGAHVEFYQRMTKEIGGVTQDVGNFQCTICFVDTSEGKSKIKRIPKIMADNLNRINSGLQNFIYSNKAE